MGRHRGYAATGTSAASLVVRDRRFKLNLVARRQVIRGWRFLFTEVFTGKNATRCFGRVMWVIGVVIGKGRRGELGVGTGGVIAKGIVGRRRYCGVIIVVKPSEKVLGVATGVSIESTG